MLTRMSSSFDKLQHFIREQMQMSHIYQPVMLMSLLRNNGKASVTEIAKDFLSRDSSQIEYYEEIVKRWPTTTLKSHGLIEKTNNQYNLKSFDDLTPQQVQTLVEDCEVRLAEFLQKQSASVFDHRRKSSGSRFEKLPLIAISNWKRESHQLLALMTIRQ